MSDMVNHPSHYNKEERKECIDEMVDIFGLENTVIWAYITAYKYRYRIGAKDDVEQEKGKIAFYEQWADSHLAPHMRDAHIVARDYYREVKE